ncbi:NAD(P)/FAD-dependent oxidoreductase [Shewanella sp. KT0246]|uniref:flavin-containing monooxygenase n=1 Tax=Shewanella sp. KT0246 TaxID=2815912 RepID=UPI001BC7B4E2|nr:NAD(P)/FAD-dependent oxidoreductase [Shewanella sp. KT0246]GIU53706.1 putative oxidoreductase CzcO [Shewanella sp. KT0246]
MNTIKDFIIIGAGQSGLSMAYNLSQQNKDYLILDANDCIGAPWLKRWDSLTLFTPTEYNHLPGMKFPFPKGFYPNKYQVADYLKSYVDTFNIPIEFNQKVTSVTKVNGVFDIKTATSQFQAKQVIIATGPFHTPYTPACHVDIAEGVTQLHSENYKNAEQLQDGDCLVVGAGDSGVQILSEIADTGRTAYFSGTDQIKAIPQTFLGKTLWWWFTKIGFLSVNRYSKIGKWLSNGVQPVIGTDVKSLLAKDNVIHMGRTLSAEKDTITFQKGSISTIKNIIWATGFKPNFFWIDGISFDEMNYPSNYRGVSNDVEGLYFIGLPWLYTRGSATLGGVYKDADYLMKYISNNSEAQANLSQSAVLS